MTGAERDARHHQADDRAAEVALDSRQDEGALHFLTHAARKQGDAREHHCLSRVLQQARQRVVGHVVQRGPRLARGEHHHTHSEQQRPDQRDPDQRLSERRPSTKEHLARRFAVRAKEEGSEDEEQNRVTHRHHEHPRGVELTVATIGFTPAIASSFAISTCVGMPEQRNTSSSERARACSRPISGGAGATAGVSGTVVIVAAARVP
jgi:hypothetical protein